MSSIKLFNKLCTYNSFASGSYFDHPAGWLDWLISSD